MMINDPAVVAEVSAAFDSYEAALIENDTVVLNAFFWDSPLALRYGIYETLYGMEEIRAFRSARPGGLPPRIVLRKSITTFGNDFATANVEFVREGNPMKGRQSQCWVRMDDGWRISAAHVSLQRETPN